MCAKKMSYIFGGNIGHLRARCRTFLPEMWDIFCGDGFIVGLSVAYFFQMPERFQLSGNPISFSDSKLPPLAIMFSRFV